jgi:uncharacterized protein with PQ loop repeat
MSYDYLMYGATILYLVCYVPELYANYVNKNANAYNVPEKVIMLSAATLGLSYSVATNNTALIINYAPTVALDVLALLMRIYYAFYTINDHTILGANDADLGPQDLESKV